MPCVREASMASYWCISTAGTSFYGSPNGHSQNFLRDLTMSVLLSRYSDQSLKSHRWGLKFSRCQWAKSRARCDTEPRRTGASA